MSLQLPSSTNSTNGGMTMNPFGANNGLLNNINPLNQNVNVKTKNEVSSAEFNGEIHLEIKSRSAKKFLTFVKGLEDTKLDLDKLAIEWRKKYSCSASNDNGVIKLTGDRRECVMEYLLEHNIVKKDQIKIHGY